MTTTEQHTPDLDPRAVANDARSILACPSAATLVIEGEEHALRGGEDLDLTDRCGTPTFLCRTDSPVARAAATRSGALLTVTSGLGPHGGPERGDTITLAGRLQRTGLEHCARCDDVRHAISLDLDLILLARRAQQLRVPIDAFRSRDHHLNRGHLQRSVEHANDSHQDDLRRSVALGTSTRPGELLGVRIARLTPADVTVQWVDVTGAHEAAIAFPRTARDLAELGEMLRRGLHAGIC